MLSAATYAIRLATAGHDPAAIAAYGSWPSPADRIRALAGASVARPAEARR